MYMAACERVAGAFRWTPVANLHLTVRFLGQVDVPVAERIAQRVAAAEPRAFDLELAELGTFKRGAVARVVWLGPSAGALEAARVAELVEAECVRDGLEPEKRRFSAHLTLARARARDGAALPELPAPPRLPPWRADELILYRSHLGRSGSMYEPLRSVRLR